MVRILSVWILLHMEEIFVRWLPLCLTSMSLNLCLPLSNTLVNLRIEDKELADDRFIPPVFKRIAEIMPQQFEQQYGIFVSRKRQHENLTGQLVYNYRDSVYVSTEGRDVFVSVDYKQSIMLENGVQLGISVGLSWILFREKIFPFHAASIMRNGRGFLFLGHSGDGKTTLCQYSPKDALVLCDEISAVMPENVDASGGWHVFPGPKWGRSFFNPSYYLNESWSNATGWSFPLNAIFSLSRDEACSYTRLSIMPTADVVLLLMSMWHQSRFVYALPEECTRDMFLHLSRLARAVPCYEISINLQTDFWGEIDKVLENGTTVELGDELITDKFIMEEFEDGALILRLDGMRLFQVNIGAVPLVRALLQADGDIGEAQEILSYENPEFDYDDVEDELKTLWETLQSEGTKLGGDKSTEVL
jgi:hypothetical protein